MYSFSKWIFIIFSWGGIAFVINYFATLKAIEHNTVMLDIQKFRVSVFYLLTFVVLATLGFMNMFVMFLGEAGIGLQLINNLLVGISFLLFLLKLKRSIFFLRNQKKLLRTFYPISPSIGRSNL
jgi:hypothetical protein